jgi:hypothetical protein
MKRNEELADQNAIRFCREALAAFPFATNAQGDEGTRRQTKRSTRKMPRRNFFSLLQITHAGGISRRRTSTLLLFSIFESHWNGRH